MSPTRVASLSVVAGIRLIVSTLMVVATFAGCGDDGDAPATASAERAREAFGEPPAVPAGPLDPKVIDAARALVDSATAADPLDGAPLETVVDSGDARLAWLLSDLLRFAPPGDDAERLVSALERLTDTDLGSGPDAGGRAWLEFTDRLIAWDLPAPAGYRELKGELFGALEPGWRPFFADRDAEIDWRLVTWGGVRIDDRGLGDPRPCPRGCIPALDDPELVPAAAGDWYPDRRTVFGLVVGGEAVALPKNIMEVHEMVNVTIGGRRLAIPYCTLCGSAQAYFLDSIPDRLRTPVMRTSGLLSRSNKVMYDLRSRSVFDTFTGRALSGPLQEAKVSLEQGSVVASAWGAWKRAHPETTIVAEDGGIGRHYPADPLGGRDDDGPIFPVGDVDPRLPVQAKVVGVVTGDDEAVAFPVEQARAALAEGEEVSAAGVEAVADGGGLRVLAPGGEELPAHQAFWFAWSQFHPDTELWSPPR
jgi:hypothetical protein